VLPQLSFHETREPPIPADQARYEQDRHGGRITHIGEVTLMPGVLSQSLFRLHPRMPWADPEGSAGLRGFFSSASVQT